MRSENLLAQQDANDGASEWNLKGNVYMRFGSEPDIAFEKKGSLSVLVEVKGGEDPAGALERLGAVKKTFDEALVDCRSFLVIGVVTPTTRARLGDMRIEADFNIDRLLGEDAIWRNFMNEIFHHGLRIAPETKPIHK